MNPSNVVLLAVALLIIADLIITYVSYIQYSKDIAKLDKKIKNLVYDLAELQCATRTNYEQIEKLTDRLTLLRRDCNAMKRELEKPKPKQRKDAKS